MNGEIGTERQRYNKADRDRGGEEKDEETWKGQKREG